MLFFMHEKELISIQKAIKEFQKHHSLLKTTDALQCGIQPRTLYAMRDQKIIEQLARGLFRLLSSANPAYQDLVIAAKKFPKGIICLLSALDFHGITSQIPHQIYIAYQQNWHQPKIEYPPIKIFRLSETSFNLGIEQHILDGIKIKVYSPEKTLVDCFKFRNKIGLDVAIEALKLYWQKNKNPKTPLITKYAKICHVDNIMRPYLETLSHE